MSKPTNTSQHTGIIAWFIYNPVAANLLMLTILIVGYFSMKSLNIQGFPSIEANTITVDVTYPSGSAKRTEEGVTIKIEQALKGLDGIKKISSTSTTDSASIVVEKETGYNLSLLNEEVTNKVNSIYGLPASSEKPVITKQKDEENALWIDIYGEASQQRLQALAQTFEDELRRIPTIKRVEKSGWMTPEISIEVDEEQLQAYKLSIEDISSIVAAESVNETSGQLRSQDGLILLKADKQRYSKQDFANIIVRTNPDGSIVTLGEIATIKDTFSESPKVLSRFQGQSAINFKVLVNQSSNILTIADDAKTLVEKWQNSERLPDDINISVLWDQSQFMVDRLSLLASNGITGIILVMLVLTIFLNIRVAFWVGMGLPISFAGALFLMGDNFFNLTLNDLTTFGFIIVLGILVDDAVVVGESIYSTREKEGDTLDSTIKGVKKIAVPTLFGVLTTVAAFYPMSFIAGDLGSIFGLFALVAVGCLIFSLIESKLILPAHLAHIKTSKSNTSWIGGRILKKIQDKANNSLLYFNTKMYQPLLAKALNYRYVALCLFITVFILVVGMIPSGKVGFVFFPNIPRDIVEINYSSELGQGYNTSHQMADNIEQTTQELNKLWLQEYPNSAPIIKNIQVQVLDDTNGYAMLELNSDEARPLNVGEIENALRDKLVNVEGIKDLKVISDFISIDGFALNILANNRAELEQVSTLVTNYLDQLNGVNDIQNSLAKGAAQLEFELTAEGRALGITTAALAKQISYNFYGAEVQRIQRGKDEVKVFVRYPADKRKDVTNLEATYIRTPNSQTVPLSTVAQTKSVNTFNSIAHTNSMMSATITANVDKAIISPDQVMTSLSQKILVKAQKDFPGVEFVIDGESAEMEKTMSSMIKIFGLSIFLIYVLVAIPLKSYLQPLIIMSAIPFGIVGAILGHWIANLPISILSLLGILALSGVVVNNSLLLVSRFNEIKRSNNTIQQALSQSCQERLRAIFLTSITTYAGLSSLLNETSEQAAYLIPAAASLAYGILFSTVITLILVPVLLMVFNDISKTKKRLLSKLNKEQQANTLDYGLNTIKTHQENNHV